MTLSFVRGRLYCMHKINFITPERYKAYVSKTSEKVMLHTELRQSYAGGELSIRPHEQGKRVLDLGCGIGANLPVLCEVFGRHTIFAIDASVQLVEHARESCGKNVIYITQAFEDFPEKKFDFILASHVLQYVDTDPRQFIAKIYESLSTAGEAWIVQQTAHGMAEIITHQREFLIDSRFSKWRTFHEYVRMVDELSIERGFRYKTQILGSSFEGIQFDHPTDNDKLRLEFILGLQATFDTVGENFQKHLRKIKKVDRVYHPNGIIKIYKSAI